MKFLWSIKYTKGIRSNKTRYFPENGETPNKFSSIDMNTINQEFFLNFSNSINIEEIDSNALQDVSLGFVFGYQSRDSALNNLYRDALLYLK